MDIDKENRPVCECHGEEMRWHKKNDRKSGGTWTCKIKIRQKNNERYHALKNTEYAKKQRYKWSQKYIHSEKGKQTRKKHASNYSKTEKGKISYSLRRKRYAQSEKGKKAIADKMRRNYNTPGTYCYEHKNPNGSFYGETLRKRNERTYKQANERDLNKLWQLQN